jgi:hypothetical protein
MSNTVLSDGEALDMGAGGFLILQVDEYGVAQSVFITKEDRALMDAADEARGA